MLHLVAGLVSLPGATSAPIVVDGTLCHPTRLIVRPSAVFRPLDLQRYGVTVERAFPQIGYLVVETRPGALKATRDQLRRSGAFERVDYDRAARPAYVPNDPMWPDMWHARTLKADKAWDLSFGSPVVVAVIDTGVDVGHPDLAANVWTNPGEIPGNGLDDDQNGYVDDVHGWDFDGNDAIPNDVHGHGTACSGLVAAVQDNNIGCSGVAPRGRIMGLKASTDAGYFYDSRNIGAYLYGADNGARVFSMSFYSDRVSAGERAAMDYAWSKGVLPVAAAGNANTVYSFYPSAYESVLAVAAINTSLNKASFSDFGTWVDVASPGVQLATITAGGGYTTGFAGTSGSCPQVAGAAALIWGANPLLTNDQVRSILEDTATPTIQSPYGEYTNYGLVDVEAAMVAAQSGTWPGKSAVVRYATPLYGYAARNQRAVPATTRIYGRGFQSPRDVQVLSGGRPLKILARSRDWVDVLLPEQPAALTVRVDGATAGTIPAAPQNKKTWPAIEAATQGAALSGGFAQMLAADGNQLTCSPRSDKSIVVQATFRRVTPDQGMTLLMRRSYTGSVTGTERIYLYDWASASYPYGNFTLLAETSVASIQAGIPLSVSVPNFGRYIDDEGTVYFYLETNLNENGGRLLVDQLNLFRQ